MIFFGKNRRPRDERKLEPVIMSIILAVCIFAGVAYSIHFKRNSDESFIHQVVGEMGPLGEENETIPSEIPYQSGTPESEFLTGLQAFWQEDYVSAKTHFQNAADNIINSYDRGLPGYTYYYLSRIALLEDGEPDFSLLEKTILEAATFKPLANSHQRLWKLLESSVVDDESSKRVKELLSYLLTSDSRLELVSKVRYNNCIAMLDYFDGNYAMSLMRFYDVRKLLDGVEMDDELLKQSMFCVSYIAGFYYDFNDIDRALEFFLNNVNANVENPVFNARQKYSDYLNIVNIYLEKEDCENARHYAAQTLDILEYLPEDLAVHMEIAVYDRYARSYILEKELETAKTYLDKAEKLLKSHGEPDGDYYENRVNMAITEAQYLLEMGKDREAGELLVTVVDDGTAEEYGKVMEVYELLVQIFRDSEDINKYFEEYASLMKAREEYYNVIQKEYLELSRYYATVGVLMESNDALRTMNRTYYVIMGLAFAALVGVLVVLNGVVKANFMDQLTTLYNRKKLNRMVEKYKVTGTPPRIGVVMIDIDYFKRYNDTYGHVKGDDVLRQVAKAIKNSVRRNDTLVRYGGEEFMIIIDNVDEETAKKVCDRVLQKVRDQRIPHKASDASDRVTISMGLCYSKDRADLEAMIGQADHALYTTKINGRNHKTVVRYVEPVEQAL